MTNNICRDYQLPEYASAPEASIPYADLWDTPALQHLQTRLATAQPHARHIALGVLNRDYKQYRSLFPLAKRLEIRAFLEAHGVAPVLSTQVVRRLRMIRYCLFPPTLLQQHRQLQHCPFFDAAFYLQAYPDVRAEGVDPLTHYLQMGWKEERDPGPNFSTRGYLNRYPEVAMTGLNPLWHFEVIGRKEGRVPHVPKIFC